MLAAQPIISEFLAKNDDGLRDAAGRSSDWIEIQNAGDQAIDLAGWYLTDDANLLEKWEFPSVVVQPGAYLVLFASGNGVPDSAGNLHTNFQLSANGEYLALTRPDRSIASQFAPAFPQQFKDVSYGIEQAFGYFLEPTPGATNGRAVAGFVDATNVDVARGFHNTPFDVNITSDTPGATIVYTTDGSAPTLNNGTRADSRDADSPPVASLRIETTTTLRAAAFKEGFEPSGVDTQTYIFLEDVIQQSATIPGFPSVWDGMRQFPVAADYEMDPDVVNDPAYRDEIIQGLMDLPTISIVMDPEDLFGQEGGIYINSGQRGKAWERPTSVEIIEPDGSSFQVDSGIRIHGFSWRYHRNTPKHSFRLEFRDEYGPRKLKYPLFPDAPVDEFDSIVLRAQGGRSWGGTQVPSQSQYLRDTYARDLAREMGAVDGNATLVHLYLNGVYWGLYNPVERPDAQMGAEYFGGSAADYDALNRRTSSNEVIDGDLVRYNALIALANSSLAAGVTTDEDYAEFQRMVAMDDFIDWFIRNQYVTNRDGLTAFDGNNQRAIGSRVGDPQFRFFVWDMEYSMWDATDNNNIAPGLNDPALAGSQKPSAHAWTVYNALRQNEEFRLRFADHVHEHFLNDGALTPANAAETWEVRARSIERAIIGESARWGDAKRATPYTRDVEWQAERKRLLTRYFPYRTAILLNQYRTVGLYPSVEAPELNQHGGLIASSFDLELSAPAGTIYYTTDGSDPRLEGGRLAPTAIEFTRPFRSDRVATVKARVLSEGEWSPLNTADFQVTSDLPLRISEINYNPHDANLVDGLGERPVDNDQFEFIELVNVGSEPIDLNDARLAEIDVDGDRQGVTFQFTPQRLGAGQRIVVVRNRAAFQSRYGDQVQIAAGNDGAGGTDGAYGGKLSNNGEQLALFDAAGTIVQQLTYGVAGAWPGRAAGAGSSLEVIDTAGDFSAAANWRASSEFGGSPGVVGLGPDGRVVVNEVLAGGAGGTDQIELHNTTDGSLDMSNWYLSDSADDYLKFQVAASSPLLAPDGYRVLDYGELGFTLDSLAGGDIWVVEADARGRPVRFVDRAAYRGSRQGESQGRWPDGTGSASLFPMIEPTLGTANSGPIGGSVIVSEVHYQPAQTPTFTQNFNTGSAAGITPRTGIWNVDTGRYHVRAAPDKADAIALVTAIDRLSRKVTISATMRIPSESTVNRNGVLIFDYHGPYDFKFASIHAGGGTWRMGRRDEKGWQFLDAFRERLLPLTDTDLSVMLELRGSVATLRSNGRTKVSYDFGEPLVDGQIALGTKGGEAFFDDLLVAMSDDTLDLEFMELVNTTGATIDLSSWRLAGAIDFTFDAGTTLASGETLVIVPFAPDKTEQVAGFQQRYGTSGTVRLVGPYAGALDDDGGLLELLEPVGLGGPQTGAALVDRVRYGPFSPWPAAADGEGSSLQRSTIDALGDLGASWKPVPPTPGRALFATAGDLNLDGTVDSDDVAGFALALDNPALYETTFDAPVALAGDLDGDGDVDFDDIEGIVARLDGPTAANATRNDVLPHRRNGRTALADRALEQETSWYEQRQ